MRRKPNLGPRLEKCAPLLPDEPASFRGRWRASFGNYRELHVELGCGKGRFTADAAAAGPEALLIAIERDPSALVMAAELAMSRGLSNVRFILGDVGMLFELFAPGEVGRIYLNFPDPWPKSRDAKLRLTAPNFLRRYASVLSENGELHFKTARKSEHHRHNEGARVAFDRDEQHARKSLGHVRREAALAAAELDVYGFISPKALAPAAAVSRGLVQQHGGAFFQPRLKVGFSSHSQAISLSCNYKSISHTGKNINAFIKRRASRRGGSAFFIRPAPRARSDTSA